MAIFTQHDNGVIEVFDHDTYQIGHPSADIATCGTCERSWDDAHVSGITPTPSGRCPFEYEHPRTTADALSDDISGTVETIRAYVAQIESGEYGDQWEVTDTEGNAYVTQAADETSALANASESTDTGLTGDLSDWDIERVQADEPTIEDTPISEYPLEIVDQRGREYGVVLTVGGPHIEVVADGTGSARLEGYWSGERVTRYGDYLTTFLDYFIDRD